MSDTKAVIFNDGKFQGIGNNGQVVPYGKLYFYESFSGNQVDTFTTSTMETKNTWPVVLSASGKADVFLTNGTFDVTLRDKNGVTEWTINNFIAAGGDGGIAPIYTSVEREDITGVAGSSIILNEIPTSSATIHKNGSILNLDEYEIDNKTVAFVTPLIVTDEIVVEYGFIALGANESLIFGKDTIEGLLEVDVNFIVSVDVRGYHAKNDGGGGIFNYDSSIDKSTANAGTIIDPDETLVNQGNGTGSGCWVRQFSGAVSIRWFGAVGNATTNDHTAITNAYNYAGETGNKLDLTGGIFSVEATLDFDIAGVVVNGNGRNSNDQTTILVNHTSGVGIHISAGNASLIDLRVRGADSRYAAGHDLEDAGILISPPDTVEALIGNMYLHNVQVDYHNGSGIVVGNTTGAVFNQCIITKCKRHAFVAGNTDEITRTNEDLYTGMIFVSECRFDADWYSVFVGGKDGVPRAASNFRIHFRSCDSAQGPTDITNFPVGADLCGWWIRGHSIIIEGCAIDAGDTEGDGLVVSGTSINVGPSNRFLHIPVGARAVNVLNWISNSTTDVVIESLGVIGDPLNRVVALSDDTTSPAAPVADNTVSVSVAAENGTVMTVADKERVSYFNDQTESNVNTEHSVKALVSGEDSFIEVASGVLDVTGSFVSVVGEGSVADTIDTITFNGGTPKHGMQLVLTAGSSSVDITIANFTGNIHCGADRVLSHGSGNIVLKYSVHQGKWIMLSFIPDQQAEIYTPTNVSIDRSFDADTVAVAELADVVGTLVADLQFLGLIK